MDPDVTTQAASNNPADQPLWQSLDVFIDKLPPISEGGSIALQELQATEPDMSLVEHALKMDPLMVARILRVANSPFYGFAGRIADIRRACLLLGIHTLKGLVQAALALEAFPVSADSEEGLRALWRHSVHTAIIAKSFAESVSVPSEAAFTAGLLHDIGLIALMNQEPDLARAIENRRLQEHRQRSAIEQELLGFDHGEIGASILRKWRLPEDIASSVYAHGLPTERNATMLADIVHVAEILSRSIEQEARAEDSFGWIDNGSYQRLGLSAEDFNEWHSVAHELDDPVAMDNILKLS